MSFRVGETVYAGEQGAELQDFVAYSPSGGDVDVSGSARALKCKPSSNLERYGAPSARHSRRTSLVIPHTHLFDPMRGERFHSVSGRLTAACSRLSVVLGTPENRLFQRHRAAKPNLSPRCKYLGVGSDETFCRKADSNKKRRRLAAVNNDYS